MKHRTNQLNENTGVKQVSYPFLITTINIKP